MDQVEHTAFAARSLGPVVFVVWRGAMTADAVEAVGALLHRTAARSPSGIAFVTTAGFRAPIPSAEARARIVEIYGELGSRLVAVAQVVEGDGFWASAALCFIAGVGLLHRHAHANRVFGNIGDATDWIASLGIPDVPTSSVLHGRIAALGHALALGTVASAIGEETPQPG